MAAAELALLGGILGTLITALSAASIAYFQRRTAIQEEHRLRAFDRHLSAYEQIFTACRSVLDALNDYAAVDGNAADRADPFLRQVLDILRSSAYQYCAAVDWRRSPGMAYLDLPLEKKCLRLRDLLLEWLSRSRLSYGDVAPSIAEAGWRGSQSRKSGGSVLAITVSCELSEEPWSSAPREI